MSTIELNIDWLHIAGYILKPLITIVIWSLVDRLLRKLHEKSGFIDKMFAMRVDEGGDKSALKQRVKTLKTRTIQIFRILNLAFFVFILMGILDIDRSPLIAGMGVIGLGLSLAAQNILRDFIYGVFILVDDLYNVGDFVTISGHSGTVEAFTMRTTKVRELNGTLVTIPNGTIELVENCTKDFSMAFILVGVPYTQDPRRAMEILERVGRRARAELSKQITADAVIHGIVDFRESDMLMRMLIRTHPGEHWPVERAVRLMIKDEFAKEGIPAPFPHVYNHVDGSLQMYE